MRHSRVWQQWVPVGQARLGWTAPGGTRGVAEPALGTQHPTIPSTPRLCAAGCWVCSTSTNGTPRQRPLPTGLLLTAQEDASGPLRTSHAGHISSTSGQHTPERKRRTPNSIFMRRLSPSITDGPARDPAPTNALVPGVGDHRASTRNGLHPRRVSQRAHPGPPRLGAGSAI